MSVSVGVLSVLSGVRSPSWESWSSPDIPDNPDIPEMLLKLGMLWRLAFNTVEVVVSSSTWEADPIAAEMLLVVVVDVGSRLISGG